MRHRIEEDIYAEGIAVDGKLVEILGIVGFALPERVTVKAVDRGASPVGSISSAATTASEVDNRQLAAL